MTCFGKEKMKKVKEDLEVQGPTGLPGSTGVYGISYKECAVIMSRLIVHNSLLVQLTSKYSLKAISKNQS